MKHDDTSAFLNDPATAGVATVNGGPGTSVLSRDEKSKPTYSAAVRLINQLVSLATPNDSILLVISRGDDALLDQSGRCAWHFPRAINGKFAGCYPASSTAAIDHLECLRAQGAQYLVIPSTSFWWLEYYTDFTRHLQQHYRIALYCDETCVIYALVS